MIELLVVIAIIAILASLLLPGLARAKASAINLKCKSNIRQIGILLALYTDTHGAYPPVIKNASGGYDFTSWTDQLGLGPMARDTRNSATIMRCPSPYQLKPAYVGDALRNTRTYGYNDRGFLARPPAEMCNGLGGKMDNNGNLLAALKPTQVRRPADMIMAGDNVGNLPDRTVGDAGAAYLVRHALTADYLQYAAGLEATWKAWARSAAARHNRRANIVFCDGHVEGMRFKPLFLDSDDAALSRWNYDHESHRQ